MNLTEEQKIKINENKQRALQLLARKKAEEEENIGNKCVYFSTCRSQAIDEGLHENFAERICSICKLNNPLFELVTRSEANSAYLVTDDALRLLKFQVRNNPHNSGWTPMKLYLRKHVIEQSVKRFGSLDEMEIIKKEREAQRFEKNLDRTHDVLGSSTKDMWDRMNESGSADLEGSGEVLEQAGRKRSANQQKVAPPSKRKQALSSLVGIIKGTGT